MNNGSNIQANNINYNNQTQVPVNNTQINQLDQTQQIQQPFNNQPMANPNNQAQVPYNNEQVKQNPTNIDNFSEKKKNNYIFAIILFILFFIAIFIIFPYLSKLVLSIIK